MGESEEWTGGATPFHMAERLVAVMDALRVERADLVAMDMGGQPALVAAARHPERVRRLVVMNSLVWWEEETSWEIRVLRQYGWNRILIRWLPRLVFYRALATFLPRGTRLPAEIRDEFWRSFRRRDVRRFIARMCAGYQALLPRLPEECQKIKCPTLLLWGARDKHFPPRHAERLAQQVLSARRVVIPEAHHWMAWYRAPEVAGAILDFMASA
jgi:pimeloyl-ACP methyl ester carboxylesterase